jgi:biotin operon repressor
MLSPQQLEFMIAFQNAMGKSDSPVTVGQIAEEWGRSDIRVRAHIKRLMPQGYVVFVGKTRWKQYVAGFVWAEEDEADLDQCYNIGGQCEVVNCENDAKACFRGKYLCRDCLTEDNSDTSDIERYSRKSSMGWFDDF